MADRLMGDLPQGGQNLTFAQIRKLLKESQEFPFPIFSSILKDSFDIEGEYEWFEVTPFSCGSDYLDGSISTKYLGSEFKEGDLKKERSEETLGFLFGIFGSPYDLNVGDILLQIAQAVPDTCKFKDKIINYVHLFIKKHKLAEKNFLSSKINNPTYKMNSSSYAKKDITLADAGFDFNITVPPLLKRKVDVIICCDDSTDSCKKGFPELKLAKRYADKYNYLFPSLKYYKKVDEHLFVFKWNKEKKISKKIPTVIYFGNPFNDSTFKLQYDKKEFNTLCDYMKDTVIRNKDAIIKEIVEKSG